MCSLADKREKKVREKLTKILKLYEPTSKAQHSHKTSREFSSAWLYKDILKWSPKLQILLFMSRFNY